MTEDQAIQYNKISELSLIGKVEESKESRVRTVKPVEEKPTTKEEDGGTIQTN